jgi:hypothetical protein
MAKRNCKTTNAGNAVSTQTRRGTEDTDFALVSAVHEAAKRLLPQSVSAFKVGELAIIHCPGYELDGSKVEVVCEYSLRKLASRYDANGNEYQYGYMVRALGDRPVFCPAHTLRDPDHSIRHLRLVSTAQQATATTP